MPAYRAVNSVLRHSIRFYLNEEFVELHEVPHQRTLLDFLRLDRGLRGTKEGCAEGDCGACTVMVGRLDGDGRLTYETINACIRMLASLDGLHIVTIEQLAAADGALHPVQQAMVDHHGSQCGFCTPGIVMSLYNQWLDTPKANVAEIETALQGNLCRCTGYGPIVRAAQAIGDYGDPGDDRIAVGREAMTSRLLALRDDARIVLESGKGRTILPASSDDLATVLAEHPEATLVAGATDVGLWVTKFMRPLPTMVHLNRLRDLRDIEVFDDRIEFGALVSYTEALDTLAEHVPPLGRLWRRIGGAQIRNAGTIGGNIANGSPIGDTPPPLIALGATIVLRRGDQRRTVLLEDFFIEYGRQDRQAGEFIERIVVPMPRAGDQFAIYKVSKRHDEDISSLLGAFRMRRSDGVVSEIVIAYGGMAGIPKRAGRVEAFLLGKRWTRETVETAMALYSEDFRPLSDWRASAEYRLLAARNLLLRFWVRRPARSASR